MLRALLIVASVAAAAAVYAVAVERSWYALRRHRVPCLPRGARPLLVLHVSDLHLRARQARKRRFLRALARLAPDLVVGTGDFLGDAAAVGVTVETMTALRAGSPALFVLGSNDYYSPLAKNPLRYLLKDRRPHVPGPQNPWEELVAGLEAAGWLFASNRATSVGGIEVAGLDDAHIGRADLSVATARAGDGFRLAVAHSPDVAASLASLGYDLILCGHTHGGQVRIPGVGAIVTNCSLPRRMARGLHRVDGAWLHVCAGLGTSMYAPYRFACRPEVCALELVPRGD